MSSKTDKTPAVDKALDAVGNTVESFADRIGRKLREQETLADQSRRASEIRHDLILHSLTTIRRALQETAKIKLGERFFFDLSLSDWEGWPRLDLNLRDRQAPANIVHALVVTANDRSELGLVQLNLKTGQNLGRVSLTEEREFEKLPNILKTAIRKFLDVITPFILNPTSEAARVESGQAEHLGNTTEDMLTNKVLAKVDLFEEEQEITDDNKVASSNVNPVTGL